ncbi:Zn-ribbon containing protein [Halobacteria archaeon AArc-m2/3/4]|uniref:Zn-ribbon containing protein n=1 Tax=Natronoglomus mannanivorans TaxID=2979990 RepID=A0ABT2QBA4_9EURY|nr:Zn-ribbon containing protein [Halobacteria archaeon AArc-m2/3/4]
MPHQCTNCDRTFPDGSKEMLSGCPDCGGNKFQFAPAGAVSERSAGTGSNSRDTDSNGREQRSIMADENDDSDGTVSRAAETVRDWVSSSDPSTDSTSSSSSDSRSKPTADSNSPAGNRPWPDADDRASSSHSSTDDDRRTGGSADDSTTFEEWPETARPPADRSEPDPPRTAGRSTASETTASSSEEHSSATRRSVTIDDDEDTAQADARSAVVSPDDLPASAPEPSERTESDGEDGADGTPDSEDARPPAPDTEPTTETVPPDHGRVVSEPSGDRPSLDELRDELNDQFESIKIVSPGQYELNLMELYDREEYIVSLQEDGRYVIDVPDSWRDSDD